MPTLAEPGTKQRIASIDIVRGLIMLLMAIDHTRDFFLNNTTGNPTNMATTTPIIFFTRWVTHYCAPNFVFLSGISAYLAGRRRSPGEFRSFLIKRGLWLVVFEIVFLSFALTLDPGFGMIVLQVIWAIGVSMIILALLSRASLTVIATIGLIIVLGHDILDYVSLPKTGAGNFLITMFFTAFGSAFPLGKSRILLDLYAIIPWTGVMLLGYVFGQMYTSSFDPKRRKRILLTIGLSMVGLFIILRYFNIYGDPAPWSVQRTPVISVLSFLNASKYPPSLLYLCMTIGPTLVALSFLENVKGKFASILIVYGNVPFFYYILHIYLIRALGIIVFFVQGYKVNQIVTPGQPFNFQPPAFGFGLGGVYLVWLLIIIILYFPCRWYSKYKRTHHQWWLSYL
ncbi:MAG TPA: heparan-alpha-glucosaminide N-acetyltransferase domain-containing protein [Mucilaginibacter sp.]|nr:heparan-alpha-glucosaminide N-acetyltransferase domain-containing protein [Mucilaginibacter sp.]